MPWGGARLRRRRDAPEARPPRDAGPHRHVAGVRHRDDRLPAVRARARRPAGHGAGLERRLAPLPRPLPDGDRVHDVGLRPEPDSGRPPRLDDVPRGADRHRPRLAGPRRGPVVAGDRRRRAVHRRRRGRAVRWGKAGRVDPERGSRRVDRRTGGRPRRPTDPLLSSADGSRHPPPDARGDAGVRHGDEHRLPRARRRREDREGRRGAPPALGPRPRLGGVRRRSARRHVPLVRDAADGSRLRPGAGNGAHRRIRHGRPPPAGDPAGDGRPRSTRPREIGARSWRCCTPRSTRSTAASATAPRPRRSRGRSTRSPPSSTASPRAASSSSRLPRRPGTR